MIDEKTFNKAAGIVIMAVLAILSFFIIKPVLISCLFALILSFILYPVYLRILKLVKSKNLSALIVSLALLVIVIAPILIFAPLIFKQGYSVYLYVHSEDFSTLVYKVLVSFFTPELSSDLILYLSNFTGYISKLFLQWVEHIPTTIFHLFIIVFLFFFGLRDGDKLVYYIQSLSPLSEESEKKVFQQFKDITYSVIYGNIVVGIIHGLVTGIALFVLGIPNPIVLTLLAVFFSVIPLLGPWIIWVPVDIYLFTAGRTTAAVGLLIYGLIVISWIDNILRPLIVSRRTKINSGVIFISMIGGIFVFGVLGLIIGPLIIAYLLLMLEPYRKDSGKKIKEVFIHTEQ